jgi:hypothetical protein
LAATFFLYSKERLPSLLQLQDVLVSLLDVPQLPELQALFQSGVCLRPLCVVHLWFRVRGLILCFILVVVCREEIFPTAAPYLCHLKQGAPGEKKTLKSSFLLGLFPSLFHREVKNHSEENATL